MKLLKGMVLGLFAASFVMLLSSVSFAEEKNPEAFVKLLKDSAMALQQSNPALSDKLIKFAKEEAKEKMEKEEKNEAEETKEPKGMKGHEGKRLQEVHASAFQKVHEGTSPIIRTWMGTNGRRLLVLSL